MSRQPYLAAAVQLCAGSSKHENFDKVESFAAEAAKGGARLVVLPEVFLWRGERTEEAANAEPIPGPSSTRLAELARRLHIVLVAGSVLESNGTPRPYNTSIVFSEAGAVIARYRKMHLFDVDIPGKVTIRESDTRAPGDEVVVAATQLGNIGMSICYDLRFPELYRALTWRGAEIIVVPAAFTFPTGAAHWEVLLRARAIENQVYVIAPNQIGMSPSGILDYGNSLIIDPWGKALARAADREALIFAEIHPQYQAQVRRQLPCLDHVRLRSQH